MSFYFPELNSIVEGNCLEVLKRLPSDFIDCVVTSPPYWGLRDYGTSPIVWGGELSCPHDFGEDTLVRLRGSVSNESVGNNSPDYGGLILKKNIGSMCSKCGAWRGELGSEPTPNMFVDHLCTIFDEIFRILKDSGTCWVNLGDTYAGSNGVGYPQSKWPILYKNQEHLRNRLKHELPDKCLYQIPSRFSIAMTDRKWVLRNEIVWHKPNAMPQSIKDRFTVDFEKMFFFTKVSKGYYFQQQTERKKEVSILRDKRGRKEGKRVEGTPGSEQALNKPRSNDMEREVSENRNKRCVWSIPTKPCSEAHFAVFPDTLVEPCILSGCPVGGIVLDPFFGSGTVGVCSKRLGRNYIGIELSPEYIGIAQKRLEG